MGYYPYYAQYFYYAYYRQGTDRNDERQGSHR